MVTRRLDEEQIRPRLEIGIRARKCGVEPSTATASVRAMMRNSLESRVAAAARIFPAISSREISDLSARCPQRLGSLVLELDRVRARTLEGAHRALHIQRVAVTRIAINDQRHAPARG